MERRALYNEIDVKAGFYTAAPVFKFAVAVQFAHSLDLTSVLETE